MKKQSLIVLCLVVAVDAASFGLLLPVVPFFVHQLTGTFNPVAVTSVTATYSGLQFLGAPLIGRLSDRYGRRQVLTITVAVSALALLGSALAKSLVVLLLFQALNGASSGVFAIAQAVVADSVDDPDQRTIHFGAIGAALGLGFIFGPGIGGALGAIDPRLPFAVAAAFCMLNVLLIRLRLPDSRPSQSSAAAVPAKAEGSLLWNPGQGELRRLLSVYFLFYLGFSAFTGIFVLAAKDRFDWGPQPASWILMYVGVVAAVVQGGLLPRLLKKFRADRLSLAGLTMVAAAMLAVSAIERGGELYLTQLLFASGVGLSTPGLRSAMSQCVPDDQQGVLGGLTQSVVSLTSLLGPLLAGQTYALTGYALSFQIQAILVFAAVALLGLSPLRRQPIQAVNTPSA
ncbi:tetracycline resistance MFS efflux pump [Synechococcus sp. BS56D]|uniref:MFS transporter n=1 Tax=Synechococcus sp. BS56D TaxID=2055944 RepID=UPI00103FCA81|nr:MFS transporter [Synechococcus sp. BS56D]TCD58868.1 tetracycline resistance MFS efflux pump [Synechococcus sp. BS56D]